MNAEQPEHQNIAAVDSAAAESAPPARRRASRRVTTATAAPEAVTEPQTVETSAPAAAETPAAEAPKKRATRSRKKTVDAEAPDTQVSGETQTDAVAAEAAPTAEEPKKRATRGRRKPTADAAEATEAGQGAETVAPQDAPESNQKPVQTEETAAEPRAEKSGGRRGRGAKPETARGEQSENAESSEQGDQSDKSEKSEKPSRQGDRAPGNGNGKGENSRSTRTRQRDRKRRNADDLEPEITEDDVLLPIAGLLDVLDNYAFVRTSGYLPGVSDVYVSLGQVKKYGLRRGDAIVGAIRQPREGDGGGRQKYNALVKLDTVNGRTLEENEKRVEIDDLTPIYPEEKLGLGLSTKLGAAIDAAAPVGLGQRALVTLPADVPAAPLLAGLAASVSQAKPEAHLMLVLTNVHPEAVTELQRSVRGEVITATFDRPVEDQVTIAELAIDRARRLVELGHDVVVLIDSLSDVAQALVQTLQGGRGQNADAPQALAIAQVKRLVAAARNLENSGSLTLIAAARHKGHSPLDKQLRRELKPIVSTFVQVSGSRVAPEVDADASYTIGALS